MNKVITINLGGVAYQLEDAGFDALSAYLETAKSRLQGNPDRDEILSDIERAIGEKFSARLSAHKNVILEKEVTEVLAEMGEIADDSSGAGAKESDANANANAGAAEATGASATGAPRRLYRIQEGAFIAGVCNGIGAYFNVDPTFVRFGFVAMTLAWGMGIPIYIAMAFLVPMADSPEEKAAAYGVPATAQEFIRRAKRGYYDAVKSWPDRQARREWKRRFKQDMREWRASFHSNMAASADSWRRSCPPRPWPMHPGAAMGMPFISLLHGAILILWIWALVSVFAHGTILGMRLPAGMPIWVAALLIFFAYGIISCPLKAARRSFYYYGGSAPGPAWALFAVINAFVWVVVVAFLLWLAYHHFPEAREAMNNVPVVARDAADSIRNWWHSH